MTTAARVDWGVSERGPARARAVAVLTACLVGLPAVAGVVTLVLGVTFWVGAGAALAMVAAVFATRGFATLRAAGATRVAPQEELRLQNLVAGLADDLGLATPLLYLMDAPGPNALICWRGRAVVAVTRAAVSELNRTELEAIVAHCLRRLKRHSLLTATIASIPPLKELVGRIVDRSDDVAAAALTRYPPALVAVLEKAVPATGSFAAFYFAAEGSSHAPIQERIDALVDL